ncbi:MAG: ribosomal protein S5, nonfunctional [Berkelbacteria bacterium GW2011_GWB1_38_5]|uniref:Small ribosomal subunit protein uS5 n=2 Tax=Candidatus Berkelbacteria TaxID=1618330 RepID=A0A0G0PNR1_9BACT|nr:MAG: ribosomal protein S5, nonfunctional [Berkelbacteria bacterium GW2011_GWB1_38_5]KKQ90961.1 MAG: ribosomal protein S5, nonfunctional [Berkelbacteria bacterium GW2011_GWA1_39_10]
MTYQNTNRYNKVGGGEEGSTENEKKVLQVDRISRTVRGGKRIRFRVLVIIGNRAGRVGIGVGKATEVANAVTKATRVAQKNMIDVPITNETIPYKIEIKIGAAHIILKPARPGTSIIAGGAVRVVCELAGIRNIVGKILGTANKINNSIAVIEAFKKLSALKKDENETK